MPFIYPDGGNNARYESTGEICDGRPLYCVVEGFLYRTALGRERVTVAVEAGFITDLASIPSLPFLPNPGGTLWDDAAIVHDQALHDAAAGELTRAEADVIFYRALRDRGCSVFTATVFWLAVRIKSILKRKGNA
jgi:hypothetical protein